MIQASARPLPPAKSSNSPNNTGETAAAPNPEIAWRARKAPRRPGSAAAKSPVLMVPESAVATTPEEHRRTDGGYGREWGRQGQDETQQARGCHDDRDHRGAVPPRGDLVCQDDQRQTEEVGHCGNNRGVGAD